MTQLIYSLLSNAMHIPAYSLLPSLVTPAVFSHSPTPLPYFKAFVKFFPFFSNQSSPEFAVYILAIILHVSPVLSSYTHSIL